MEVLQVYRRESGKSCRKLEDADVSNFSEFSLFPIQRLI